MNNETQKNLGLPHIIRSNNYKSCNANAFSFRSTIDEFAITFASSTTYPGTLQIVMQEEATITLSLMNLKVLSEHLEEFVARIEQNIGKIKILKENRKSIPVMADQIIQPFKQVLEE